VQARARRRQGQPPIVRGADQTSEERQVGLSALSRAAKAGHTETVGLLLNRKAEIDAADQVRVPDPHANITRRSGAQAGVAEEQNPHLLWAMLCYIFSN